MDASEQSKWLNGFDSAVMMADGMVSVNGFHSAAAASNLVRKPAGSAGSLANRPNVEWKKSLEAVCVKDSDKQTHTHTHMG